MIPKAAGDADIWSTKALTEARLPSLHSTLFGAFQLIDRHLGPSSHLSKLSCSEESYIDFGFGSDKKSFSGVHRFSVRREAVPDSKTGQRSDSGNAVRITHSSLACNPSQNKPFKPGVFFTLHKFYAILLFREGVAQVLHQ